MSTDPAAPAPAAHPVRLEGRLDESLSRGLWLIKWLLLIPHVVVLVFLWLAFLLFTLVAFFAILITARFPRSLFDFNVGVMRWTWRVGHYGYSALGTDRYPPFRLAAAPEDPAQLEVAYPEQLNRWLVLVKWLLVVPHSLLVGIFLGGGGRDWDDNGAGYPGLVPLLVFFAGVALLFTARYPHGVYRFVLGLNRWAARTAAYLFLLTDVYPPFRLDQGATEPAAAPTTIT
jgi:hypothetical protein